MIDKGNNWKNSSAKNQYTNSRKIRENTCGWDARREWQRDTLVFTGTNMHISENGVVAVAIIVVVVVVLSSKQLFGVDVNV